MVETISSAEEALTSATETRRELRGHTVTTVVKRDARTVLRRAAARARLAPSIHNTQPWHLDLGTDCLDLRLDPDRQLTRVDPDGRQALISCGCALFNARVSLAGEDSGDIRVTRFPQGVRSSLLARIEFVPRAAEDSFARAARLTVADLDFGIAVRRTNRTRFDESTVPEQFIDRLAAAAAAEGTVLFSVRRDGHREAVARLTRRADTEQHSDPAYRAELRAWVTDDADRRDGVHTRSVARVDADSHDEVPLRDFDLHGNAGLPARTGSTQQQTMLLLGTDSDTRRDWLRSGEALERVLLTAAVGGYECSPIMQALEIPQTRAELRTELGVSFHPQFLLRVGRASPVPPTVRRALDDVLSEG